MMKCNGQYRQIQLALCINNVKVPTIVDNESFVYLGQTFNFAMGNSQVIAALVIRLTDLLKTISSLKIQSQSKL